MKESRLITKKITETSDKRLMRLFDSFHHGRSTERNVWEYRRESFCGKLLTLLDGPETNRSVCLTHSVLRQLFFWQTV
jgi:hypothetical protein